MLAGQASLAVSTSSLRPAIDLRTKSGLRPAIDLRILFGISAWCDPPVMLGLNAIAERRWLLGDPDEWSDVHQQRQVFLPRISYSRYRSTFSAALCDSAGIMPVVAHFASALQPTVDTADDDDSDTEPPVQKSQPQRRASSAAPDADVSDADFAPPSPKVID